MTPKDTDRLAHLRRERERLLRELPTLSCLLRGSLFRRFSTCSRPSCPCRKGARHGPRYLLAVTAKKRQKQHYVPKSQIRAVRRGVRQYHRLLQILDRLTAIHLILMRKGCLHEYAQ